MLLLNELEASVTSWSTKYSTSGSRSSWSSKSFAGIVCGRSTSYELIRAAFLHPLGFAKSRVQGVV